MYRFVISGRKHVTVAREGGKVAVFVDEVKLLKGMSSARPKSEPVLLLDASDAGKLRVSIDNCLYDITASPEERREPCESKRRSS